MELNEKTQKIWDSLVEKIENNPGVWEKPWFPGSKVPRNFSTKREYSGYNVFVLEITRIISGYKSNNWITFNQAKKLNQSVKKGEKGTPILAFSPPVIEIDEETGEKIIKKRGFFFPATVFNIDQTTIEYIPEDDLQENKIKTIDEIEDCIQRTGAKIVHTEGNRAFYSPVEDMIVLPMHHQFKSQNEYYGTKFHELIHWTGHESRLNRLTPARFGSNAYSREELVAEIGSVFMQNETGMDLGAVDNAAAYIKGWWSKIKEDRGSLIDAASKAQRAVDYIISKKE